MSHGPSDWIRRRQARPQRPAWPTLKRIGALHRGHLALVLGLLGAIAASSLLGLAPPLILQHIIDNALRRPATRTCSTCSRC